MTEITFSGLNISYDGISAVNSFAVSLHSGQWLCLIGPNGAGKSSILRAAAGLVKYSGSITIDHHELSDTSVKWRAQHVAYVPQSPIIPNDMSVFDYVLLGRTAYIRHFALESSNDLEVVVRILARLDLTRFSNRMCGTLSGGERQRLVIARALTQEAPVLLLDEPTTALDVGHQQQALELVDVLRREQGLIVVSAMHDLTLAGLYSDQLVLLHQGVCVAIGTAKDVLRSEILAEFYGVNTRIHLESDGTVVVIPRRLMSN